MSEDPRSPQRAARRREEILDAAADLFRREGIAAVNAGRIASVAGVSSGNLYYWFSSKDEIIRELFRRWADASAPMIDPASDEDALAFLWNRPVAQEHVQGAHLFFSRELLPLLHADPVLAAEYAANAATRRAWFCDVAERAIAGGLLARPAAPSSVELVVEALWLIAESADAVAEVLPGSPGAVDLSRALIAPLLTADGRRELALDPTPS